jgi:hypothetical protein
MFLLSDLLHMLANDAPHSRIPQPQQSKCTGIMDP